jgi:NAD(P)-dependent dehydrogenase (short-subunit alcohol dehydrogenase family)
MPSSYLDAAPFRYLGHPQQPDQRCYHWSMATTGPDRQLEGRVAVVTGGNGGIGFGIAEALLDAGATVEIWGRDEEKNATAVARLGTSDRPSVFGRRCDVADEADVEQAFAIAAETHPAIDVMFANAGIAKLVPFLETSLADWHGVTAVDLDGVFLCFREAARHMQQRGGGALVAVSSISALHGSPSHAAYAASKAGLLGLVRSAAVELARYGIRANAMLPGWIAIDTHPEMRADARFVEATTRRTPVRRWGTPEDLRRVAVFLADPTIVFHTGDTIVVDGGYTVQ